MVQKYNGDILQFPFCSLPYGTSQRRLRPGKGTLDYSRNENRIFLCRFQSYRVASRAGTVYHTPVLLQFTETTFVNWPFSVSRRVVGVPVPHGRPEGTGGQRTVPETMTRWARYGLNAGEGPRVRDYDDSVRTSSVPFLFGLLDMKRDSENEGWSTSLSHSSSHGSGPCPSLTLRDINRRPDNTVSWCLTHQI